VYRNYYCGKCNNDGSFQGMVCSKFNNKSAFGESSPEYEYENIWNFTKRAPGYISIEYYAVVKGWVPKQIPPDFTVLLNWRQLRERATCQQDTEQYDPFKKTCRTAFMEAESKCKFSSLN
jgi:hypothetical protein